MIRATTPTHFFKFPEGISAAAAQEIEVAYSQCGRLVLKKKKSDMAIDASTNTAQYTLKQKEMNKFCADPAQVQVRLKLADKVMASRIFNVLVKPVLDSEEL